MPKLQVKVEGRGNGIKTLLTNVTEVGASLAREPSEITKFFGCILGSQTTFAGDRHIVNGSHNANDLQKHLCKYIEAFVLCKQCKLPETHYKIKGGIISQKCQACGNKDQVDMTHKLTTFILAQYKEAKSAAKAKGETKPKKANDLSQAGGARADSDDETSSEVKKASKKEKKDKSEPTSPTGVEVKEKKSKKSKSTVTNGTQDGLTDVAHEGGAEGTVDDDGEDNKQVIGECIESFRSWLVAHGDADVTMKLEQLRHMQQLYSLRASDKIVIFIGAVCTENILKDKEIETHTLILSQLASSNIQQRQLIAGFEWLCGTKYVSLLKFFPAVLMQLFEQEIIEEDVFFEWTTDLIRNEYTLDESMVQYDVLEQLRMHSQPFIKWLQEAEEEGDEEEEEEGDEEDDDAEEES